MNKLAGIILGLIVVAIVAAIVAIPVWLLWNAVMPDIFGVKTITFLQALGLSVLCSLLFKSDNSTSQKG